MIKARYTADGNKHTLSIRGHANYGEYGKDIVCAGVSAIVQALMGWVENNPHTAECVTIDDRTGEIIIACEGGEDVSAVFSMTTIGLEQISRAYPDHSLYISEFAE